MNEELEMEQIRKEKELKKFYKYKEENLKSAINKLEMERRKGVKKRTF